MVLTASATLDIQGLAQTITFNNPGIIDEIDFGSNQITLKAASSFTLPKSDFLVYAAYHEIFHNALIRNFPSISNSLNLPLPLCEFDFRVGSTRLTFIQTSNGGSALEVNYFFGTTNAVFSARVADVTITLQEWFMMTYLFHRYVREISLH